jgi:hypothetical protein
MIQLLYKDEQLSYGGNSENQVAQQAFEEFLKQFYSGEVPYSVENEGKIIQYNEWVQQQVNNLLTAFPDDIKELEISESQEPQE